MGSGIASLHKVLRDETRRKIILLLQEKGSLSYVDLMKTLGITNTGKMNYHLKILGDLLSKKEDGQYALTEKGTLASRLLLEFPEVTARQMGLSPKGPQVLWWGIIICGFAVIGLFILLRYLFGAFMLGYTYGLEYAIPFIFVCAVFLFIGAYMIISDLKKNAKTSHKLTIFTKWKAVVLVFFIMLGMGLIGLATISKESDTRLIQIGYENNMGGMKSYTIFLQQGLVCRVDLTVSATEIGQTYEISVKQVEENYTLFEAGGPINGQVISQMFLADSTGHYEVDWHELNVTQLTVYRVDEVTPLIPKHFFSASGVFAFIAVTLCFLGFERNELFYGRKTGFFWLGLIIFGLVLSWLFGLLWLWFFIEHGFNGILFPFFGSSSGILEVFVILVFLYVGFWMMRKEAKKESEAYGLTSEMKIFKLKFDLSERNYRALVYLLASMIINVWLVAISGSIYYEFLFYINIVGFVLVFLFFGRPTMYGGWFNTTSILAFALLVFGLFVEIFVVCEFVISITKLRKKS